MQVCFIGHRVIQKSEKLLSTLKQTIIDLVKKGTTTFLFGSMSAFDEVAWGVVTELKALYPFIKRVYVRSTYSYIDTSYEDYLLGSYEETYFPAKVEHAGKASYVERNREMINRSTYCVFYYDENYTPLNRNSGTKHAYLYALKKKKQIINLYDYIL